MCILSPRQDGCHFADDIFTCIFFNENCCILIKFSLKYVCKGPIDNNPALVQILAWHWSGSKPLFETMMVSLPMHICVTLPQWVHNEIYSVMNKTKMHHHHRKEMYHQHCFQAFISAIQIATVTSSHPLCPRGPVSCKEESQRWLQLLPHCPKRSKVACPKAVTTVTHLPG